MAATGSTGGTSSSVALDPLGVVLRRFRRRAGLSQQALAEAAGVSATAIWLLEQGRRRPHPHTLNALSQAMQLTQDEHEALLAAARDPPASATPIAVPTPEATRAFRAPPEPPTSLIGRGADVAAALALLQQTSVPIRLLTLVGPGGVGKTRLGMAIARALQHDYADGVAFVDLAPLRNPSLMISTVAWTLGLHEQGGQTADRLLVRHLRDRHLLLMLDNFEHLRPAAPQLSDLVEQCPGLTLLVTSRAALRLRAERRFVVDPLTTPAADTSMDPAELAATPAVRLFVERTRAVVPGFALGPANAEVVAAICRRLEGLPLALELAATRMPLLPAPALLDRLERHLALPSHGLVDLPDRQQTLRATLAWSHDLLDRNEQVLFRRLAVFVGGCTLEAVETICADDCVPAGEVPTCLQSLLDNSLVLRTLGGDGEPRFRMLETIREDAAERLTESGEADALHTRHRDFFVAWAEYAMPELTGRHQLDWYARLTDELDNLRAANEWTRQDAQGAEAGLRLAAALGRYFHIRAPRSEGRTWLAEALAAGPSAPSAPRARALTWCGQLDYLHGETDAGRRRLEQAVAAARHVGEPGLLCLTLRHLALYTSEQATAPALLEEAVSAARQAGNLRELAFALGYLGTARQQQGDEAAAEELYLEAIGAARASEDVGAVADALLRLGDLRLLRGEYAAAESLLVEALASSQRLGYQNYSATVTRQLAQLALARGDLTEARARIRACLELARASSNANDGLRPLQLAARLAVAEGNCRRAVRLFGVLAGWQGRHDVRPGTTLWARGTLPEADAALASARTTLGEHEFATNWAAGLRLTPEAALTEALTGADADPAPSG
ncbi:MAG: helix-turn-helix domain-containing protein [Chloroflexi bacterium]|nr:helix-turn-helix domain-containing protein [Chloroflexota bacterium]